MARLLSRAFLVGAILVAVLAPVGNALGFLDSLGAVGRLLGKPYAPLLAVLLLEAVHLWASGGLRNLWALEPLYVREVAAQAKDRGLSDASVRKWREFRDWLRLTAGRVESSFSEGHENFLDYVIASEFVVRAFVERPAGWLSEEVFVPTPDGRGAGDDPASRAIGANLLLALRTTLKPWTMRTDAPWLADHLEAVRENRARFVRVHPRDDA